MNDIDKLLYRPLKQGKEYNSLIPAYKGIDFNFDKPADNSTTHDTLQFMSEWALKYANQMSKIAPLLKASSLDQTCRNVYQFLYHHFQYKLDGETQHLYSPSAAWHFRNRGFDCKTYSVLASTILQNLGIKHAFRMVKQANVMPGEWSHVYVVVPHSNGHHVIDATTHNNQEVSYTDKHDFNMTHKGLASPYIQGLGCACQGGSLQKNGLGSPAVLNNTINNFHVFLNELEKQGISREVTNKMLEIVKYNVQNGVDPNMGDVLNKALGSANQPNGLGAITPVGVSYSIPLPSAASVPYGGSYKAPSTLSSMTSSFGSQALSAGKSALSNISVMGVDAGTIARAAAGDPSAIAAGAMAVLKKVIPIEKTFGAVFANGFDLSCWGASYSEQKAKEHILLDMPFMTEWSGVYTAATTDNLNRFQLVTQTYLADAIAGQQSKYAACTRKGHALRQKAVEQLRKDTYEQFTSQGYQLVPSGQKTANIAIKKGMPGYGVNIDWNRSNVVYDSYTVVAPSQQNNTQRSVATDANGTPTETTAAPKSSSITPVAIGGALLLAAKLLL